MGHTLSDPRTGQGRVLPLGELCFPWFRRFFILTSQKIFLPCSEREMRKMLFLWRTQVLRQVLGQNWCFHGLNSAAALLSTHCLYEIVQKSKIKDVQAGVYLAHESDDASCVF